MKTYTIKEAIKEIEQTIQSIDSNNIKGIRYYRDSKCIFVVEVGSSQFIVNLDEGTSKRVV